MVTTQLGLLTCKKVEDVRYGRMIVALGTSGPSLDSRFVSISAYKNEQPVQLITCYDKVIDAEKDFQNPDKNEFVLVYIETKHKQGLRRLESCWKLNLPLN